MVDRHARGELAVCLHRLVAGEMTNDDFDDRFHDAWHDSTDAAVAEIATFGWGLYSSDLSLPYKLTGPQAASEETQQTAARAIAFLQTGLEYEWPRNVEGTEPFWSLWGPGCRLLVGLVFWFVAYAHGGLPAVLLGLFGFLWTMPAIHWLFTHRKRAEELSRFLQSGDVQAWPFLRQADLDEARKNLQEHLNKESGA